MIEPRDAPDRKPVAKALVFYQSRSIIFSYIFFS